MYHLYNNIEKTVIIVLIRLITLDLKKFLYKDCKKRFSVYTGYINIQDESYKKVIKRLIYLVFQEILFMTTFFLASFTQNCVGLCDNVFSMIWLKSMQFKVSNLNSQIFFLPLLLLLWFSMKPKRVNNKKQQNEIKNKKTTKTG